MSLKAVSVLPVFVQSELADACVMGFAVKIVKCMREFLSFVKNIHL